MAEAPRRRKASRRLRVYVATSKAHQPRQSLPPSYPPFTFLPAPRPSQCIDFSRSHLFRPPPLFPPHRPPRSSWSTLAYSAFYFRARDKSVRPPDLSSDILARTDARRAHMVESLLLLLPSSLPSGSYFRRPLLHFTRLRQVFPSIDKIIAANAGTLGLTAELVTDPVFKIIPKERERESPIYGTTS